MHRRKLNNPRKRSRQRETLFSRTVLCTLGGITEHDLRLWEHEEFIAPADLIEASNGAEPVYDQLALRRIRTIRTLADELGVNLPGIGVILHLLDQFPPSER